MINVLILEDDRDTAWLLATLLPQISPDIHILAVLTSVKQAMEWLNNHDIPHLIFADTELSDGLSFEIFEHTVLNVPVVFISVHENYSLQAFGSNAVDYLIKPIDERTLRKSFDRLVLLKKFLTREPTRYDIKFNNMFARLNNYKNTILVYSGLRIIPVNIQDIFFIQIRNKTVFLNTATSRFEIKQALKSLIEDIDPREFYRANRQYIIARKAVTTFKQTEARKLEVVLKIVMPVPIIISKEKVTDFLKWMKGDF